MDSISPPNRPHYPWKQGEILIADELNAAIANAGRGTRVTDWIPGGQPDGVTDLAVYFQAAIDDAADADSTNRAAAPGLSVLIIPPNPLPYVIGQTLYIPSHSHIIIEAGATLKLGVNPPAVNGRCSMIALVDCATGVQIDLFGTLDGNGTNQTPAAGTTCGCLDVAVPVGVRSGVISHCAIRGGGTGRITNVYNWAINFSGATDVDVSDLAMTNTAQHGGSPGFTGVRNLLGTTPVTVPATIASGNYVGTTGIVTLTTTAPHFFVPGEEFGTCKIDGTFDVTGSAAAYATGCALTALPGTIGSTIVYQGAAGGVDGTITGGSLTNWAKQITPTIVSGTFAAGLRSVVTLTTTAPHNLTYGQTVTINATAGTNFVAAAGVFVLLDGSSGTTLCYTIPDGGAGGTVTAGTIGVSMKCYNSGFTNCYIDGVVDFGPVIYGGGIDCYIRGCEVSHCQSSGPAIFSDANFGRSIGCEISDCYVHDNYSGGIVVNASVNATVVKHLNTRIFNNYITRNKGGVGFSQCDGVDFSNNRLYANAVNPANIAGIAGEVVVGNFSSRVKVTNNSIRDPVQTSAALVQIAATGSTYNNTTGAVSLNTATAHNMNRMAMFKVTGTPSGLLDGIRQAQAGTTGTTLNYTVAAGLGTINITGGQVVPAGFGIMIDHPEQCVIADNVIGDYQAAPSMLAAIGGTWGVNGLSIGNYYGPRINAAGNFPADMSNYALGVQGVSYDAVSGYACRTSPGLPSADLTNFPPDGLTIGRNASGTSSEINFLCGAAGAGPGGFDFRKIIIIGASGTYNSTTAAIALTTNIAHGIAVGNVFTLSAVGGFDSAGPPVTAGRDLNKVNGSWIATAGTAGTTLNFTLMTGPLPWTGLDITSITAARVNATTTDGGLIDTTAGAGGVLFSVDGHGNATIPGTLSVGGAVTGGGGSYLPLGGGTVTGPITLAGNAALPLHAVPLQQLSTYAPVANPVFTGDPQAPTPANADNDTSVATTAFVKGQSLDQFLPPAADVSMNSHKLTALAAPTVAADAVTKAYADGLAQGLSVKGASRLATTTNLASLTGLLTIDGVVTVAGDRVLVKDQTTQSANGIYVVASGAWTRATDADAWGELVTAYTLVQLGTVNASNGYYCTVAAGGTLGTTPVTWVQFSSAGASLPEAPTTGTVYGRQGSTASWLGVLPLSGGTVTGPTTFGGALTLNASPTHITGAAGTFRTLRFETGGAARFSFGLDNTAEGGTADGSNFIVSSFDNSGNPVNSSFFSLNRLTGRTSTLGITQTAAIAAANIGSGTGTGFLQNGSVSGSKALASYTGINQWNISSDVGALTGQFLFNTAINYNFGGAGYTGNRGGLLVLMTQTGVAAGTSGAGGIEALQASVTINNTFGGTGPGVGAAGAVFAGNLSTRLTSGATNIIGSCGLEIDVEADTGATYQSATGLAVVATTAHKQAGVLKANTAITVGAQTNSNGFEIGYAVSSWGLGASGTVFLADFVADKPTFTVTRGFDLRALTTTSDIFAASGFAIGPTGRVRVGTGYFDVTATGAAMSADGAICTAGTLTGSVATTFASDGNSYYVDDPYGGMWLVTFLNGTSSITAITLVREPVVKGAPPANPVTLTPRGRLYIFAPGTITANLTWDTSRTTLAIQAAGGATTFGGPVTLPAGTTGPFLPLTGGTVSGATTYTAGLTVAGTTALAANNTNFGRGNTYVLSGSTFDATKLGLFASNNISGTSTLGEIPAVAYVVCNSANVNAGATNLVDAMEVTMVTGGANAVAGSWQGLSVNCNDGTLATNDKAGGGAGGFLALQVARRGGKNQGGTGLTPSTGFGSNWGIDVVNVLTSGATNHYLQNGLEINQSIQTGASVVRRAGLQISSPPTHVNRAALFDNGILIANGAGAATLRNGIMFGSLLGGAAPLGTDSGLLVYQIGTDRLAPANIGIDFNDCTFTTAAMRMPGGFSVSPAGALQLSTAFLTPTTGGLSIDATGSVATGTPAITSGGSGYNPGEVMEDGQGGVYYNNSVASGAITSVVVIVQPTYPTTSPPATLTMTSRPAGVGTGCVLTPTWSTTRTTLALQPTAGGKMTMPALQASTTYANDAAAATGGVPIGGVYRNGSAVQIRIV